MSDLDFHEVTKEDWSGGEIAPSYQGRISSPEYKSGSALLYNMLPRNGGGARRRPGSRFITVPTLDTGTNFKLFKFTAVYGQQFKLLLCIASGVATVYVYSVATHALVGTVTTNVSAYLSADIPSVTIARENGQTWLFLGKGAGTPGGVKVCYISNASNDGSGAWSATQPTFTNTTAGSPETFGSSDHFPSCGVFYAGRLYMSGINANPHGIWGCTIPAPGTAQTYLIFTIPASPTATDGIYLLQNFDGAFIRWLFASQSLLMGTEVSVWMYPDGVTGTPPTPASFWLKKSASYGALAGSLPVQVQNVALYLGSEATSFRSLILSMQRGYFADGSLSEHAEHLMARKAVDFCVTLKPDPTAWIMMSDGTLVSATVKQEDSGFVVKAGCGFAQHTIGGSGLVKTLDDASSVNYDELWLGVLRGTTVSLEYLYLDNIFSTSQGASFYVDCGATKTGPGTHWTGLPSPLNGAMVAALGDGGVMPKVLDTAGVIDYATSVTTLNVGFPYYSAFQGLRPTLPSKGGLVGLINKVEKQWMLVYNSMGGWIGKDAPADPLNNPQTTLANFWATMQTFNVQKYGSAPGWVSGIIPVDDTLAADANGQIYIAIVDPVPFNLVALTTRYALSEI